MGNTTGLTSFVCDHAWVKWILFIHICGVTCINRFSKVTLYSLEWRGTLRNGGLSNLFTPAQTSKGVRFVFRLMSYWFEDNGCRVCCGWSMLNKVCLFVCLFVCLLYIFLLIYVLHLLSVKAPSKSSCRRQVQEYVIKMERLGGFLPQLIFYRTSEGT